MKLYMIIGVALLFVSMLFTEPNMMNANIEVVTFAKGVEKYLIKYKSLLKDDYDGYRNHIYRVLSYTKHYLDQDRWAKHEKAIEAALVFHDIGLWTDSVLDYLDPSVERAKQGVKDSFSKEELQLIQDIILFHHKFTAFQGKNQDIVNAARMGDWADASMGLIRFGGLSRANVAKVNAELPAAGFYKTLATFGTRLHGYNIPKAIMELSKIFKY